MSEVKKIVECLKPVEAEDTLKLLKQLIKIQYIVEDNTVNIQVVLDRVHKFHKEESKPLGYFHFTQYMSLLDLAKLFLVAACVKALTSQGNYEPGPLVISNTFNSAMTTIMPDSLTLIKISLDEIRKKMEELKNE
ncbi:MAG: hypothetical protein QXM27_02915 [Candidatus Pacearchaeota archaeon]